MNNKKSFLDRTNDFAMKISEPLAKFAARPVVSSLQNGLTACMPLIIIGSVFLIIRTFSAPLIGGSGKPLIPFLAAYADKFSLANKLTMNFLGLYASVTIAMSYAEKIGVDIKSSAILGLVNFILLTIGNISKDGTILINSFSSAGLIVAIVSSILSVKVFKILCDKKITIKMPDSVPPNVGNAFTSMIPFFIIFTVSWFLRTILGFDLVIWLNKVLQPIFRAADNVFVFTFTEGLKTLLWSVGLHGDNMLNSIIVPIRTIWQTDNASAMEAGALATKLPHVWTEGLERISLWTSTVWPLLFLLLRSKVKFHRQFALASIPAAIFTIIEPVVFGLPLALNPFLMVPFILTSIVASAVSYLATQFGLVAAFYAQLPWATPPFILGPLGTGDWKTIILIAVNFMIGLIIYYPFFKAYEKNEIMELEKREMEIANGGGL